MSKTGPSIIGFYSVNNGVVPFLTINDFLHVVGPNDSTKVSVQNQDNDYIFVVDTVNDQVICENITLLGVTPNSLLGVDSNNQIVDASVISPITLNDPIFTGTAQSTGVLVCNGVNNAAKFSVLNNSSAAVFSVNTVSGLTTASTLRLTSITGPVLVAADASGNIVSASTVSGLTLDSPIFIGSAQSQGTLLCTGTNNPTKFAVSDAGFTSIFSVSTTLGSVTTKNNTLDDGSGSAFINGQLQVYGSNNASKFSVQNALASNIFTVDTLTPGISFGADCVSNLHVSSTNNAAKFSVINNSAVTLFNVNTTTNAVTSQTTTLNDGSGNMIVGNNLSVTGALTFGSLSLTSLTLSGVNNANKFRVLNAGSTNVFNVSTTADSVTTKNNTLDNGSGNMGVVGTLRLDNTNNAFKFIVTDSTGLIALYVDTTNRGVYAGGNVLNDGTDASVFAGPTSVRYTNATNKFQVLDNSSANCFNVNSSTKTVTTAVNTLDNGSGLMTIPGALTLSGANNSNKIAVYNNSAASVFAVDTAANTVYTRMNVLDNGSGLMTLHSTSSGTQNLLSVENILGTANNGVSVTLKGFNASAVATTWTINSDGTNMNIIPPSVGLFRVYTGSSTLLSVNRSTFAVATNNNTLDNGAGTSSFVGAMSVSNTITCNDLSIGATVQYNPSNATLWVPSGTPSYSGVAMPNLSTFMARIPYSGSFTSATTITVSLPTGTVSTTAPLTNIYDVRMYIRFPSGNGTAQMNPVASNMYQCTIIAGASPTISISGGPSVTARTNPVFIVWITLGSVSY